MISFPCSLKDEEEYEKYNGKLVFETDSTSITRDQFIVLRELLSKGPTSLKDLSHQEEIKSIPSTIGILSYYKLIEIIKEDKQKKVQITQKGKDILVSIKQAHIQIAQITPRLLLDMKSEKIHVKGY